MSRRNKDKKQAKGRDRPKKVYRVNINSSQKNLVHASRITLHKQAEDLLDDPNYNATVISIANKRINSKSQQHELDHLPKRHSPISGFNFFRDKLLHQKAI